jgi:hypothetical protein
MMDENRLKEIRATGVLTEDELAALESGARLEEPERPRWGLAGFGVSWIGFLAAAWALASGPLSGEERGSGPFEGLPLLFLPIAALLLGAGAPSRTAARLVGWRAAGLALRGRAIAWATIVLAALLLLRWAA